MDLVVFVVAVTAPGLIIVSHPAWRVEPPDGFLARFWMGVLGVCALLGFVAVLVNGVSRFAFDDIGRSGEFWLPPGVLTTFLWWTLGLPQVAVAVWVSALRHRRAAGLSPVAPTHPAVLFVWAGFGAAVVIGLYVCESTMLRLAASSGSPGGPPGDARLSFLVPAVVIPLVHLGLAVAQFFWFRANPTLPTGMSSGPG